VINTFYLSFIKENEMAEPELPDFNSLPINPSHPALAAWGLWGEQDELGMLNLLTPQRVAKAGQLIRSGKVFSLNWELELPDPPLFGRPRLEQTFNRLGRLVNDDVYHNFNTQSSTQWDGFSHYGNYQFNCFYNGVSQNQITGKLGTRNGIQVWARRGIAGRAVLLDYRRWALSQGLEYSPGDSHVITASELEEVASWQKVDWQTGDILLLRTGWLEWYNTLEQAGREAAAQPHHKVVGVAQGEATLRFLWDRHFAAVACDNPTFEVNPAQGGERSLHETLLALWGIPIGELFYLEDLATDSAATGQYDCFFSSAPLNKLGGVASPPNALAIR
jgi:kynurenine formamidase